MLPLQTLGPVVSLGLAPLLLLAACGGDKPDGSPAACTSGKAADGSYTLAVGARCLKGVTLRVQSGGAFQAAGEGDTLDVAEANSGIVLTLRSTRTPVEAFELRLPAISAQAMLQQGYQSWGFSGAVKIPDRIPLDDSDAPVFKAAATGDPVDEVAGLSYGSAVLGGGAADFLAVGAVSAARATTGITAVRGKDGVHVSIVYGALREPLPQRDGKVVSEGLALFVDTTPGAALAKLGSAIGAALPAGSAKPKRPPGGWYSWNEHFDRVDEAIIRKHIDALAGKLAPKGMTLLEIDDGWEKAWGDWQANEKFPSGMKALGAAITGKGLMAGVWMAPFLVDVDSAVAKTLDPALLVHGEDGKPLLHRPGGHLKNYYVLDGTNPASMAIATDAVKSFAAAGYRFFKLDFLYAGALVGGRSKAGATGNEALRSGIEALRAAAGPDAFINACGAPPLPSLGVADSLRIGSDTVYDAVTPSFFFVASAARSLAARGYLNGLVWPDADQVLLRPPFTEDEARVGATVAALAGPAYALGDDIVTLDPARLAIGLGDEVLDIAGGAAAATAEDLFASPAPGTVGNPVDDLNNSPDGETSAPPPSMWSAVGKSGARYAVTFSWAKPHKVTVTKSP
jgi:Melibiase